jgi:hypothetical protein
MENTNQKTNKFGDENLGNRTSTKYKTFAINNNEIVCEIDVAPFSEEALDEFCVKQGFDGWVYNSPKSAMVLMGIRRAN